MPEQGGWINLPVHFGWQVVEVSKLIKSSPCRQHVSPISHPSDHLQLTSPGAGQPRICGYLNECTHKESIQLFSFMYEIIRGKRPLPNGFICPFHLLVSTNLKPSSLPLWPTLWVCLCLPVWRRRDPWLTDTLGHWSTESEGSHFLPH